ncbi:exopolyphosphatase [Neisseriaceae bacterium PsAf]|nr:exopolyphosphatase [Neisseriaceae bacterium PsAf]MCV2502770.1 Ppx/GppA family phosphatase [Neisseriaceae bacterium]
MDFIATGDLGSNSFRLTISKNIDGQYQTVDSIKDMIHFATGLDENDFLDDKSQERALQCLQKFGERLRGFKENQVRVVATNTFRVAKNINSFMPRAEEALGFPIEIVGGHEEARLIYTGIVHMTPFNGKRALIVDIGGGSTEFIVGLDLQLEITESLNIGCVTYSKHFFDTDNITDKNFDNAIKSARSEIQRIRRKINESKWDFAIGSSGTAKAIGALYHAYNPNKEAFDYDFLVSLKNQIIKYGSVEKAKFKEIKSTRVEVFAGGVALMIAIFEELKIKEMQVTDAGLRDGVLYDFIGRQLDQDLRDETVENFQSRYFANKKQADNVSRLALEFFDRLNRSDPIEQSISQWQHFITWASKLHEIGLFISYSGYHRHSSYIIENADMSGFSSKDQYITGLIILGHKGNLKKVQGYLTSKELWYATISLRLATIFCRARNGISIPDSTSIKLDEKNKNIILKIEKSWMDDNPLTASVLEKEASYWKFISYDFVIKLI